LVIAIPPPGCNHRKHEDATHANQFLIGIRIVLADFVGHMGDVKLDRPATTRLQVDEEQPLLRPEQVAWVRLAVQQLLSTSPLCDRPPQTS
jgi:hypothetical protein